MYRSTNTDDEDFAEDENLAAREAQLDLVISERSPIGEPFRHQPANMRHHQGLRRGGIRTLENGS